MTFVECWIKAASALFPQALAGEPTFQQGNIVDTDPASLCIMVRVGGALAGSFEVVLSPELLESPLLGESGDAKAAWIELLREVAEAAAGDLLASTGQTCRIERVEEEEVLPASASHSFELRLGERVWVLQLSDQVRMAPATVESAGPGGAPPSPPGNSTGERPGIQLLLDVELEVTLRFGCRELQLAEVLSLGPGDVVQLDRHVSDPVDLVVGDKIVAHGEVVLVNGNFGLRVTEVAAPRERLESIRCLF